jgi:hypothetical protein
MGYYPGPWWLHGYYGVPPERSLLLCRTVRHPLTLARWLGRRLAAALVAAPAFGLAAGQADLRSFKAERP